MATPRLMVVLLAATGVVVAGVVALTLQSWWVLAAVLALHGLATAAVVAYALHYARQTEDKPDPVSEARLEEERTGRRGRRLPWRRAWRT